jgi:hypothetical protein
VQGPPREPLREFTVIERDGFVEVDPSLPRGPT